MHKRRGLFFQSLLLTLLLILPMAGAVVYLAGQRSERQAAQAEAGQSTLAEPAGARNTHRLLLAVQGEAPAFLLLRLDGPAQQIRFCALPGEQAPAGTTTLAACYLSAGPARAAELLMNTVGIAPDAYLAATADGFADLWGGGSGVRFDTSSVLPEEARGPLGYGDDPVAQLEAGGVPDFLAGAAGQLGVDPPALARVRGAVWAAFFRQGKEVLPGLAAHRPDRPGPLSPGGDADLAVRCVGADGGLRDRRPAARRRQLAADRDRYADGADPAGRWPARRDHARDRPLTPQCAAQARPSARATAGMSSLRSAA